MAQHNELGRIGEDEACYYLMHRDYSLLDRNWRYHHLEIDIVAEWHGEIVFVEVKTRRNEHFATARDAVTLGKQSNIVEAGRAYMSLHRIDSPYRFDIITVVGEQRPYTIRHFRAAYGECRLRTYFHHRREEFEV